MYGSGEKSKISVTYNFINLREGVTEKELKEMIDNVAEKHKIIKKFYVKKPEEWVMDKINLYIKGGICKNINRREPWAMNIVNLYIKKVTSANFYDELWMDIYNQKYITGELADLDCNHCLLLPSDNNIIKEIMDTKKYGEKITDNDFIDFKTNYMFSSDIIIKEIIDVINFNMKVIANTNESFYNMWVDKDNQKCISEELKKAELLNLMKYQKTLL